MALNFVPEGLIIVHFVKVEVAVGALLELAATPCCNVLIKTFPGLTRFELFAVWEDTVVEYDAGAVLEIVNLFIAEFIILAAQLTGDS